MLSGYPPFEDEEPVNIYKKIIVGKFEFKDIFDSQVKNLIKLLLHPDVK